MTDRGLIEIRHGFGAVVDGNWSAFNGAAWFNDAGPEDVQISEPTNRRIDVISPKHARVFHTCGDVTCTYDYTFEGEDVLISCRIENLHAGATLTMIGFSGLTFHFIREPKGILPVAEKSEIFEMGIRACHPSSFSSVGGSYAIDREVGVGASPWNASFFRTLLLWDYADWEAPERDRVLDRKLIYFANSPIPPGGSATIGLKLRVSPELEWQHLLQPYQEQFQKLHGSVQYDVDARWLATDDLVSSDQPMTAQRRTRRNQETAASVRPRSLQTPEEAQAFCDALIPRLLEANGQGAILKSYGLVDGVDQTDLTEFDLMPPPVAANWNRITSQFAAADLKFGVAARPGQIRVRVGNKQSLSIPLDPDQPAHREMVWQRFQRMIERDCNVFLLDSFGDSLKDVQLMRWLREKMGPDIATFADHPCDALMVVSGGYTGAVLKTSTSAGFERGYTLETGEHVWEIFQWLAPGCQMTGQLTELEGRLSDSLEQPDHYFFSRHITPMVPLGDLNRTAALEKFQSEFVSKSGAWLNE